MIKVIIDTRRNTVKVYRYNVVRDVFEYVTGYTSVDKYDYDKTSHNFNFKIGNHMEVNIVIDGILEIK